MLLHPKTLMLSLPDDTSVLLVSFCAQIFEYFVMQSSIDVSHSVSSYGHMHGCQDSCTNYDQDNDLVLGL